jgi:methylglyoxal synthase
VQTPATRVRLATLFEMARAGEAVRLLARCAGEGYRKGAQGGRQEASEVAGQAQREVADQAQATEEDLARQVIDSRAGGSAAARVAGIVVSELDRRPVAPGAAVNAAPPMPRRKQIALIAHDNRKSDLLEWSTFNRATLAEHEVHATGTTGALLARELGLPVNRFLSGPLGGDQQVGAAIAEGRIDFVIFFWDPLEPHPHDVDVKALLRIAVVYNVPIACNRASADFMLSSPLMSEEYQRIVTTA